MTDKASEHLLTVDRETVGENAVIVRLEGEIDLSSSHLLSSHLTELANQSNPTVILDATKVTFMDSTGLHALVEGKRALHEEGIAMFLVPLTASPESPRPCFPRQAVRIPAGFRG